MAPSFALNTLLLLSFLGQALSIAWPGARRCPGGLEDRGVADSLAGREHALVDFGGLFGAQPSSTQSIASSTRVALEPSLTGDPNTVATNITVFLASATATGGASIVAALPGAPTNRPGVIPGVPAIPVIPAVPPIAIGIGISVQIGRPGQAPRTVTVTSFRTTRIPGATIFTTLTRSTTITSTTRTSTNNISATRTSTTTSLTSLRIPTPAVSQAQPVSPPLPPTAEPGVAPTPTARPVPNAQPGGVTTLSGSNPTASFPDGFNITLTAVPAESLSLTLTRGTTSITPDILPAGVLTLTDTPYIITNNALFPANVQAELRVPFDRIALAALKPSGSSPTMMLVVGKRALGARTGQFQPIVPADGGQQQVFELPEDRIVVPGLRQLEGQYVVLVTEMGQNGAIAGR